MREPMLPRERANWFDTEGNLYVTPPTKKLGDSVVSLCIAQIERSPLDAFASGAALNGVASRIERKTGNGEGYRLTIDRVGDIAKELSVELPFIRCRLKREEIRAFLAHMSRPRAKERGNIRRARILASEWDFPGIPTREPMDAMNRANWHETEGCLSAGPKTFLSKSGAEFIVSQFEIEPIQDFAAGCAKDGISSNVYHRNLRTGVEYFVRIRRLDQIALEVSKELPYLRLRKSLIQVRTFIAYIRMPRRRLSKSLEIARNVLGVRAGSLAGRIQG